MSKQTDFFAEMKEWSKRKLNIITKYLDGFSRILGSSLGRIYYVDGFAGQGVYNNGEKGSPVLAAEYARKIQSEQRRYQLRCINVELNPEIFDNLIQATISHKSYTRNFQGYFKDNLSDILSLINDCPALFFLDDFGMRGTNFSAVEPILARREQTDLWIKFDHKTVLRIAGFFDSDAIHAEGKLELLSAIYGIEDMDYLRNRIAAPSPEQRVENAVTLYLEVLRNAITKYKNSGFAAAYPIRTIENERKYYLVFACSHPKAATLASNVVNGIEETFEIEKLDYKEKQTGQLALFRPEITEEQTRMSKIRLTKNAIRNLGEFDQCRIDLHYSLLVENPTLFGKIRGTHLTSALKELREDEILHFNGPVSKDTTRVFTA